MLLLRADYKSGLPIEKFSSLEVTAKIHKRRIKNTTAATEILFLLAIVPYHEKLAFSTKILFQPNPTKSNLSIIQFRQSSHKRLGTLIIVIC